MAEFVYISDGGVSGYCEAPAAACADFSFDDDNWKHIMVLVYL